jgi:IclR family transcriptional regulator, KDG regulon repressor
MIRAVGRALAIFDAFDSDHTSLSLQEIGHRIKMPKTTAFRLVNTLEQAGFLIRMDNQQYCLSLKLARLGGMVRSTLSVRDVARPVMLAVNQATSETVTLNTIIGSERMVLEVVDTPSPLMSMARQGQHMPLLMGASSRIMMAYMESKELEAVLKTNTTGKEGKALVRAAFGHAEFDRAAFDRELARFRRQGYAISRGQRVPGLTAISAPIIDMEGTVRHCLSLTGPSVRIDPRDLEFAEIMVNASRDLANRLGASPQSLADLKHAAEHEVGVQAASTARRKKTSASTKSAARLLE